MKFSLIIDLAKESLERLRTDKPVYFKRIQAISIIIFILCGGVEAAAAFDLVKLSDKVLLVIGGVMFFLSGTGLVAQLPTKDNNQK